MSDAPIRFKVNTTANGETRSLGIVTITSDELNPYRPGGKPVTLLSVLRGKAHRYVGRHCRLRCDDTDLMVEYVSQKDARTVRFIRL